MNQASVLAAVALGNLCDCRAQRLACIAVAVTQLVEIDERLMRYAIEEDRSGIDRTAETEECFEQAGRIIENLPPLSAEVFLYYNDEVDEESPGRIRLEIPGTHWDATQPLQFH